MTPYPTPQNPQDMGGYMDDREAQGDDYQAIREDQGDEYQDIRQAQGDEYQDQRQAQGDQYADQRQTQGDQYQSQREAQGDEYADQMEIWGEDKAEWQRSREKAIQGAEGMLKSIFENYGTTFKGTVATRWAAMGAIMAGLVILIIVFQKRKDVV
jgi:hypothetical protein